MGWSIGFDNHWQRDIGYGVPAYCDHPGCGAEIDRGLTYVCGGEPYGGEHGCGLYFCDRHLLIGDDCPQLCPTCLAGEQPPAVAPVGDHPAWLRWKLTDPSWAPWRAANPDAVQRAREALAQP